MATMVGTINMGRHEEVKALSGGAAGVGVAKNVMLFFAAPFIGLAYIIAMPLVGTAAILRLAVKALI